MTLTEGYEYRARYSKGATNIFDSDPEGATNTLDPDPTYSVMQSDGNSFCGDVLLDSINMAYS